MIVTSRPSSSAELHPLVRQDLLRMKSAARTVETAVALQSSGNVNGGSAEATATVGVNMYH